METSTLRGAGRVGIDVSQPDGQNIRKAKNFLSELAEGCVKYSEKFIKVVEEAPFSYREKQSTGMVACALSQFADTFQSETPVRKNTGKGKLKTFGWADFWAHYRKTDFFLELKQSYFYLHSNVVTQELSTEWQRVNEQIKSFQDKNLTGYCISNAVVSIPFMVIPAYLRLNPDTSLKEGLKEFSIDEAYQKIKNELTPTPSWGYVWKVKEDLIEKACWENESGSVFYLPALIFLARMTTTSY